MGLFFQGRCLPTFFVCLRSHLQGLPCQAEAQREHIVQVDFAGQEVAGRLRAQLIPPASLTGATFVFRTCWDRPRPAPHFLLGQEAACDQPGAVTVTQSFPGAGSLSILFL